MQEITIYQEPYTLALPQESGDLATYALPGVASKDATFLAMWLHGKAEKTQRAYTGDIGKLYSFTGTGLRSLTLADFQHFIDSLATLKPSSRARAIATVKSALSFGVKTGYLTFNVGAVVKLPKLENTLAERIMSEQLLAKMFALETNPRNHAILILLYRAGLRAAELCNLTWSKLQAREEGGQVAVFGKGKKTRFVLLDEATWREVMNLRSSFGGSESYVFQSRQARSRGQKHNRRMDESMIHRIVRRAAVRAGIMANARLTGCDMRTLRIH